MTQKFSRRQVLTQIGAAGVAVTSLGQSSVRHAFADADSTAWFFLTDREAQFLGAACDVLIPEDEFPSASQAGVVDFIDLQLATDYGKGAGLYMRPPFYTGVPEQGYQLPMTPAELIRAGISMAERSRPRLADRDAAGREKFIQGLSDGEIDLGDVPTEAFFSELRQLTNEGYFADPLYNGNKNYAGWRMVGFPGAHAYYLSEVGRHNMPYRRPPMGIGHRPGKTTHRFTKLSKGTE
jgi:gluconate 2-dehydrogenase alpha chain/gluconate 2-dehydrogenase gamma chain